MLFGLQDLLDAAIDVLKRENNRELLEAVLNHHTFKQYITPKRKIANRSKKEYRLTSREGIVKHLMANLAVEWFPVSADSVNYLLLTGQLHQSLQIYFEKTCPARVLSVEDRVAKAWDCGVDLMSDLDGISIEARYRLYPPFKYKTSVKRQKRRSKSLKTRDVNVVIPDSLKDSEKTSTIGAIGR